ncbi:MAG TPA: hypothetical protein PLN21_15500 [Gemmatales bacterium]|nr:hypothetical protein [Gemmatales bacterium]
MMFRKSLFAISLVCMFLAGCSDDKARKQEEDLARRNEALRAAASSDKLKQAQLTNVLNPAKEAMIRKDSAAIAQSVSELKKLGTGAVDRILEDIGKAGKSDKIVLLQLLGELGKEASSAVNTLDASVKTESDGDIKKAMESTLEKIRPAK